MCSVRSGLLQDNMQCVGTHKVVEGYRGVDVVGRLSDGMMVESRQMAGDDRFFTVQGPRRTSRSSV